LVKVLQILTLSVEDRSNAAPPKRHWSKFSLMQLLPRNKEAWK